MAQRRARGRVRSHSQDDLEIPVLHQLQIGHQGSSEEPWVHPESELLQGTEQNHCEVLEESKDRSGGQMTAGLLVRGPEQKPGSWKTLSRHIPSSCEGRGPRFREGGLTGTSCPPSPPGILTALETLASHPHFRPALLLPAVVAIVTIRDTEISLKLRNGIKPG
ncbi:unnamed protein product [Rangifer tarandus platyrhynchus]|uniref:Uncharacterized protein n=1 Tax=Rangifer tarandus platyrhynchus TaxID=3082113 RepID=A0AC59Y779_RANTA